MAGEVPLQGTELTGKHPKTPALNVEKHNVLLRRPTARKIKSMYINNARTTASNIRKKFQPTCGPAIYETESSGY
jgi:hypothetical protein